MTELGIRKSRSGEGTVQGSGPVAIAMLASGTDRSDAASSDPLRGFENRWEARCVGIRRSKRSPESVFCAVAIVRTATTFWKRHIFRM